MTKDRAKELLPIIEAYTQNKVIQNKEKDTDKWLDIQLPNMPCWLEHKDYRVKPEPTYIPFTYADHLLFKDRWFKSKNGSTLRRGLYVDETQISLNTGSYCTYKYLLEAYTFEDGTPCGKLITT